MRNVSAMSAVVSSFILLLTAAGSPAEDFGETVRTFSVARHELAFQQAVRLCPVSPEASFRLAGMHVQNGRVSDAILVMEAFVTRNPPYSREEAVRYLEQLRR